MIEWDLIIRLMRCFHGSFINEHGEFIAHRRANAYFILRDCNGEMDIKCKVLEWLSRDASKGQPFNSDHKNDSLHTFLRFGINSFLQTDFDERDMHMIYSYLGNAVNHALTRAFVDSGCDMEVLEKYAQGILP